MNFDLRIHAAIWALLALVVLVLALYRWAKGRDQDIMLHVRAGDVNLTQKQEGQAHALETIDRWGKALTVIVILYGLVIAGFEAVNAFNRLP